MPRVKLRLRHPNCKEPRHVIEHAGKVAETLMFDTFGVKAGAVVRRKFRLKFQSEYISGYELCDSAFEQAMYAVSKDVLEFEFKRAKEAFKRLRFNVYRDSRTGEIAANISYRIKATK